MIRNKHMAEHMSFNKTDIFERVHARTGLSVEMLSSSYSAILEELEIILEGGDQASFSGLGTFSVRKSVRRTNLNNEPVIEGVKSICHNVRFKPSTPFTAKIRKAIENQELE